MEQQVSHKIIELQSEIEKLKEEVKEGMGRIEEKIVKVEEENFKLKEENFELKKEMAKIKAYMKKKKLSIPHHGLPAELINELFGSLPFENAFDLLTKMTNGLLARNVQKMINGIKAAMKENKLNMENWGPNLTISEGGLVAKHSGPNGSNSVRINLSIPSFTLNAINKPTIVFYFEMEILDKTEANIGIGFCDQQFPLQGKGLGQENTNSIAIYSKGGIWIDGSWTEIENDYGKFMKGDSVGIGLISRSNSKMECLVTWNGKLLVKAELPSKFITMQLFPAFDLFYAGDSVRANFVKEEWQFKEFGRLLE